MIDLVREPPASPVIHFGRFPATFGNDSNVAIDRLLDGRVLQGGIEDEHTFVVAPVRHISPPTVCTAPSRRKEQGVSPSLRWLPGHRKSASIPAAPAPLQGSLHERDSCDEGVPLGIRLLIEQP